MRQLESHDGEINQHRRLSSHLSAKFQSRTFRNSFSAISKAVDEKKSCMCEGGWR